MLNPQTLPNGREQYERYKPYVARNPRYQYDYRHTDGTLFSCIKPTLKKCRESRDQWIEQRTEGK